MKKLLSIIAAVSIFVSLFSVALSFAADDEVAKDGWEISASSEIIPVKNAIDGDINTYWHSSYTADGGTITGQDRPPFIIELTLPEVTEISGLRYYPRLGGAVSGTFYDVMIYASENGTDYEEIGEVKFQYNGAYSDREGGKTVNFTGNIKVKSIKLNVLRAYTDFGTMAELSLLKSDSSLKSVSLKDVDLKEKVIIATLDGEPTEHIATENASPKASAQGASAGVGDATKEEEAKKEHDDEVTDMDFWVAEATTGVGSAKYVVDGNIDTIWHSSYKAEGSTITEIDPYPHVLTLTLPYTLEVSGFRYYPRLGGAVAGTILEAGVEISADGENFTSLGNVKYTYNGAYSDREGGRATKFDSNVTIKALRLTVTNGHGGFSTCAELHLLKSDASLKKAEVSGVKIAEEKKEEKPSSGTTSTPATPAPSTEITYEVDEYVPENWTAEASSVMVKAENAIDGKMNTYWHSDYKAEGGSIVSQDTPPFDFTITFPEEKEVSGIRYYPRQKPEASSGIFYIVTASVSDDGENFVPVVTDYTMYYGENSGVGDRTPCQVSFNKNIKAKAVRLTITHAASNFGVAAEIRVLKPVERLKTVAVSEIAANPGDYALVAIDEKDVKVTASSEETSAHKLYASNLLDESIYSLWHTRYTNEGDVAGFSGKVMPALLEFDLGKEYEISALGYMPRGGGFRSGHWVEFEIWYSVDGENYEKIDTYLLNDTQANSYNYHMFAFPEAAKARYFQIEIFRSLNDSGEIQSSHATAGDVSFFETENVQKARLEGEKEAYVLKIGSKEISVKKGEERTTKIIDVAPYIVDGTTMIPLRGLFEEMGATVSWNGDEEKITVSDGKTEMIFQIENTRVYVNDVRHGVIVAPRINNSRTFIPLRFVSEQLGYKVTWDGDTQTITIEK